MSFFLYPLLPHRQETESLTELKLAIMVSLDLSACLQFPRLGLQACAVSSGFYVDAGDSDSSLLASTALID